MSQKLRVVHYLNQFYGGYGGEDTAGMGIEIKEGVVGPGTAIQAYLKDEAEIVATIICGDNYVTENIETAVPQIVEIIKNFTPDLVIAGPGFNAGRYGLACGAITAGVTEILNIPAVTGLYVENPGTELYKDRCYIFESGDHGKYLRKAIAKIVPFGLRLAHKETIGSPEEEGYFGNGPAPVIAYDVPAAQRGIDMLLKKYHGESFQTEVVMPRQEYIPLPVMKKALKEAKIALVTDGGLVPKGNPDSMPAVNSKTYKKYDFTGKERLEAQDYEVSHQGYNNLYVNEDPNRLVPVDAMNEAKRKGIIREVLPTYYTTAGVRTSLENAKKFGQAIAKELIEQQVDAVLLTST